MKIAFIGNAYAPHGIGGAERVMQHIAETSLALGHDPVVITLGSGQTATTDSVGGVRVHRLRTENIYWPFAPAADRTPVRKVVFHLRDLVNRSAADAVREVLAAEAPDVVATHNLPGFSVSVWDMAARLGLPIVHTLHDYSLMCVKFTRFRDGRRCETACGTCRVASIPRRALSDRVDQVIGVSRDVLDRHLRAGYFPDAGRTVVHNGPPLANLPISDRPIADRPPRQPDRPLRIGFVGRVEAPKGIEVLLQALALRPDLAVELRIAGRGEPGYLAMLQARYPDPRVHYVGFADAPRFQASQDLIAVPSIWDEPLGNVVIEPWEFGVPVVGSRIGGIAELITDGVDGYLVAPGDPQALLDAIIRVRNGGLGPGCADACRRSRTRFLPETMTAAHLEVYRAAAARKAAVM